MGQRLRLPLDVRVSSGLVRVRHVDLCSGIGGFALAAKWIGWETVGFCEIDPWCQQLLAQNFAGVPQHDDLKTLTADIVRGWLDAAVAAHPDDDGLPGRHGAAEGQQPRGRGEARGGAEPLGRRRWILTAGYPCQPFSNAGKRVGTDDPRHLWPWIRELLAALGEDKPRWCVFENVAGHVSLGLDSVLSDLEGQGYACFPTIIPAAGVGALHRRDRVWIIAYSDSDRETTRRNSQDYTSSRNARINVGAGCERNSAKIGLGCERKASGDVGYANSAGLTRQRITGDSKHYQESGSRHVGRAGNRCSGTKAPETESGLCRTTDGLSVGMDDPLKYFGRGWEYEVPLTTNEPSRDRVNRLKGLGNAIVPQVAYVIFDAIMRAEQESAQ